MSEPPARRGPPWWTRAVPWMGKAPELSPAKWKLLGLLAVAQLFDQYDIGLLSLSLLQIQGELGIPESEIGGVIAVARLGVLPALAAGVLADRFGRRRLLLLTILGFCVCTFGTALVQTPVQLMLAQFVARAFIYAETSLAVVVLTEELAAKDRGWGLGMLGALGALGHAFSAIAFGFVDVLPFGWRMLYALGVIPLLWLAWFRRNLPETRRFEATQAATRERSGGLAPLRHLLRDYPGRVLRLALAYGPLEFALIPAVSFMPKTLQEIHGFAPGQVTVLYITGGALAILGNIAAGAMSDRIGRRPIIAGLAVLGGAGFLGFYNLAGVLWIVPCWIAQIFAHQGLDVLFKAMGTELFPTSHRSTASSVRAAVGTVAGALGLVVESVLFGIAGSHALAVSWMTAALVVPALVAMTLLPETATRELEEIAPER